MAWNSTTATGRSENIAPGRSEALPELGTLACLIAVALEKYTSPRHAERGVIGRRRPDARMSRVRRGLRTSASRVRVAGI